MSKNRDPGKQSLEPRAADLEALGMAHPREGSMPIRGAIP